LRSRGENSNQDQQQAHQQSSLLEPIDRHWVSLEQNGNARIFVVMEMPGQLQDRFWQQVPPPDLSPYVYRFLARQAWGRRESFMVFPAAQAEMLFNFGSDFCVEDAGNGKFEPLAQSALLGPRTARYRQLAGPHISWFIVQLTPLGCRRMLQTSFAELHEGHWPLALFMGSSAADMGCQLRAAVSFDDRVRLVVAWLRAAAAAENDADATMSATIEKCRTDRNLTVAGMARSLGIGERRLRQRFAAELGISPKQWLSLMRVNRFLGTQHPRTAMSCNGHFEYADDSHASRAFVRFTGLTPGTYRRLKSRGDPLVNTGPRTVVADGDCVSAGPREAQTDKPARRAQGGERV
jgi:AraC-like DNA-binding protein